MMMQKLRIVPRTDDDVYVAPGLLAHLKKLKGLTITSADSDIRGWMVTARDGRRVGTVDDLIVETSMLEVRYLEVRLDFDILGRADDSWVLVPARLARLHDARALVMIDSMSARGIVGAPRSSREAPTACEERAIIRYFAPAGASRLDDEASLDYPRFWRSASSSSTALPGTAGSPRPDVTNA
ncbi:MAG: PRC-barrel domain-containing protein [Gemmatimonadota bacterium]